MSQLSPRVVIAAGLAGTLAIAVPAALGTSNAQPANKAVAAGSKTLAIAPGQSVPLLSATFKTSKPEDLLINVSLECSILTDVVIKGGPNVSSETSSARGLVKVWLDLDGNIVPIQDTSAPPQDPAASGAGDDSDKVTFCDRLHRRTVTDQEDPADGIDGSEDYQQTKEANAFNWVRLNAGSGDHTLTVFADLETTADQNSQAEAVVGNRTLVIEPTKLANNAVISDTGTG